MNSTKLFEAARKRTFDRVVDWEFTPEQAHDWKRVFDGVIDRLEFDPTDDPDRLNPYSVVIAIWANVFKRWLAIEEPWERTTKTFHRLIRNVKADALSAVNDESMSDSFIENLLAFEDRMTVILKLFEADLVPLSISFVLLAREVAFVAEQLAASGKYLICKFGMPES